MRKLTNTEEKHIKLSTPVCLVIVNDAMTNICTTKQGTPVQIVTIRISPADKER